MLGRTDADAAIRPGAVDPSALVTIRGRKQDPKIARSCLQPGAKKTSRCP